MGGRKGHGVTGSRGNSYSAVSQPYDEALLVQRTSATAMRDTIAPRDLVTP